MMDISKGDRNGNGYPGARPFSLSLQAHLPRPYTVLLRYEGNRAAPDS